jgi:hypothetical protein
VGARVGGGSRLDRRRAWMSRASEATWDKATRGRAARGACTGDCVGHACLNRLVGPVGLGDGSTGPSS